MSDEIQHDDTTITSDSKPTASVVDVRSMDLNLLVALDTLLRQENVSRAAAQLNLTQSGMSRSLRRLRDHFDDPLFVRTGRGMRPTPFAKSLKPTLKRILQELNQLVCARPDFDPSQARETFKLVTWGYGETLFLTPLFQIISEVAPNINLDIQRTPEFTEDLLNDERVDLVIDAPQRKNHAHTWLPLMEDPYVLLAHADHPMLNEPLTPGRLAALHHIAIKDNPRDDSLIDRRLHQHGLRRRMKLRVSSTLNIRALLLTTDMVTILPERIAHRIAEHCDLKIFNLPSSFQDDAFTLSMGFHTVRRSDPAHSWLRKQIQTIAQGFTHRA